MNIHTAGVSRATQDMPIHNFKHPVRDGIVHAEDQVLLDKYVVHYAVAASSVRPKRDGLHDVTLNDGTPVTGRWMGKRALEQHTEKNLIKQTTSKGNVRYYELVPGADNASVLPKIRYDEFFRNIPENSNEAVDDIAERLHSVEEIEAALQELFSSQPPEKVQKVVTRIVRNPRIAQLVKEKQGYICEICERKPFIQASGAPYAEADHIKPLGGNTRGLDSPENMRCLCSLCHAIVTYGSEQEIARLVAASKWS